MDAVLVEQIIVDTTVGMGVWGINTALVFFTMFTLINRGIKASRSRQVLLAVTFGMYIGACVSEAIYIQKFIVIAKNLGGPPMNVIEQQRSDQISLAIFTGSNYLLSDGVVCWRAWVLYPQNRAAKGVLVFCMLGSVASLAVGFAIGTNLTYYVPLLFTNIVATIFVGAKFWAYRREIFAHLYGGHAKRTSPVNRILILLTECGIIYCLFWALSMIGSLSVLGDSATALFECLLPQLSCMYLSIVILISLRESSFDINTLISGQSAGSIEDQIDFARTSNSEISATDNVPGIGISFVERIRNISRWKSIGQVNLGANVASANRDSWVTKTSQLEAI
ncbi:hypothetical protein BDP27DRAFT_1421136 [Rhodocollybia butyracea]|uniref:Uncharacterized protein n=1 Tax=Rhodocollybia butyracea TaxID=206335 RepID=A0A9P5PSS3_9AGAR|nr:hypothetical protein BDP27DRAFT_1421136 [Rhodocollybia butyracea]